MIFNLLMTSIFLRKKVIILLKDRIFNLLRKLYWRSQFCKHQKISICYFDVFYFFIFGSLWSLVQVSLIQVWWENVNFLTHPVYNMSHYCKEECLRLLYREYWTGYNFHTCEISASTYDITCDMFISHLSYLYTTSSDDYRKPGAGDTK